MSASLNGLHLTERLPTATIPKFASYTALKLEVVKLQFFMVGGGGYFAIWIETKEKVKLKRNLRESETKANVGVKWN